MKLAYIIGRLISAIPTIIILTLFVFIAIHMVPGDVIDIMLGTQNFLSEEQMQELYVKYGLDKPVAVQYLVWLKNMVTGDLGTSIRTGEKVTTMIAQKFPVTFELAFLSIIFSIIIGIPFGIISAVKKNTKTDYSIRFLGLIGLSAPVFWIGSLLIVFISGTFVNYTLFGFVPFIQEPLKNLQVMLVPAITLGLMVAAQIMRMSRNSMLDVLSQEYIKVAYAKGVSKKKIIMKHALRNALIPVVTVAGIQLGYLIGGTIIIEKMFALPGMGRLLLQAVNQRDYPVVQGIVTFIGVMIILINILVDILYSVIDPRIDLN